MNPLRFLLPAALILTASTAMTSVPAPGQWTLEWQEEFDAPVLDSTVWRKCERGTADWNNYMSPADSLFRLHDGMLTLRGVANGNAETDTAGFLTGGIYSQGLKHFNPPCRLEITARLKGAGGAWPAIWLLAAESQWPKGGEIDIMERLNHDSIAYQTVHSDYTLNLGSPDNPPHFATGAIRPDGFNTYSVDILPDSLVFHINGNRTFAYPRIDTDIPGQFPFMQPQYLLIDMQLGGSWVGKINPAELPAEMDIDRVAYYRLTTNKNK